MERLLKTHQFSIGEKEYEVRVVEDEREISARVFLAGRPIDHPRYTVTREIQNDLPLQLPVDAIDELVRLAEEHVRDNERFLSSQEDQP